MEKFAKFEVPSELLGDFVSEVSSRRLAATTSGTTRRGDHIVTVPYEKGGEDDIEELNEYLDDLISDYEQDDDEEDDEEESR